MSIILKNFHDLDGVIGVCPEGFKNAEEVIRHIKQRSVKALGSSKIYIIDRREAFYSHRLMLAVCLALFKHACPVPKWVRMLYKHWEILFHSDKDLPHTCRCRISIWLDGSLYLGTCGLGIDDDTIANKADYRKLAEKINFFCLANLTDRLRGQDAKL